MEQSETALTDSLKGQLDKVHYRFGFLDVIAFFIFIFAIPRIF
jgi:hypothetical protein